MELRVSKYNPAYQRKDGSYGRREWTAYSDIGKSFGGQLLTPRAYQQVERRYLQVIHLFLQRNRLVGMVLTNLKRRLVSDAKPCAFPLRDGGFYDRRQILKISRAILREQLWGKFSADPEIYIHFGYDFSLYLGAPGGAGDFPRLVHQRGLFAEVMASPYRE